MAHLRLNCIFGAYADAETAEAQQHELERIIQGAEYAASKGLVVNAGHGLNRKCDAAGSDQTDP